MQTQTFKERRNDMASKLIVKLDHFIRQFFLMLLYHCILLSQFGNNCSIKRNGSNVDGFLEGWKKQVQKWLRGRNWIHNYAVHFLNGLGWNSPNLKIFLSSFYMLFRWKPVGFVSSGYWMVFQPLKYQVHLWAPEIFFSVVHYIVTFDAKKCILS